MDQFPKMLYQCPGEHEIHGGKFSTLVVGSEEEQAEAVEGGWHESTPEALAAFEAKQTGEQTAQTGKKANWNK